MQRTDPLASYCRLGEKGTECRPEVVVGGKIDFRPGMSAYQIGRRWFWLVVFSARLAQPSPAGADAGTGTSARDGRGKKTVKGGSSREGKGC